LVIERKLIKLSSGSLDHKYAKSNEVALPVLVSESDVELSQVVKVHEFSKETQLDLNSLPVDGPSRDSVEVRVWVGIEVGKFKWNFGSWVLSELSKWCLQISTLEEGIIMKCFRKGVILDTNVVHFHELNARYQNYKEDKACAPAATSKSQLLFLKTHFIS
jgi:hypothetical protein